MKNLLFYLGLDFSTGMILGLAVGTIILLAFIFLLLCYYKLAPKNKFFTFGRENRAMFIMDGKKFSGKVILPSKTLYADEDYSIKNKDGKQKEQFNIFGMYWIGIYPFHSVYERRQQWLEWKSLKGGGREILLRDEMTPFLIVKPFEYAMLAEEAEDINGVPLNVYFTVTLMPTNATLPIFGNDNAYGQVQTKCLSEVLLFTKKKTFANLGGDNPTPNVTNDEFSALLRKLNTQIPGSKPDEGIIRVLGYEITDAKLDKVEIAGDKKEELLNASTVNYIADEHARAKVTEAEGNLKVARLDAQGKEAIFDVKKKYFESISSMPGIMKIEERAATPNLTTLVEADSDKKTSLLVGGK